MLALAKSTVHQPRRILLAEVRKKLTARSSRLTVNISALLRLQQPGGDRDDQVPPAAALPRGLPQQDVRLHGGVLARAAQQEALLHRDTRQVMIEQASVV